MFKKIYQRSMSWIMRTRPYKWMLYDVIPYIRFTTYYPDFPGSKFYEAYKKLKPGDIILTTDDKKLTTKLIGGEITHAALCVSKDQVWEVSEMTHTDYTKSTFFDVVKQSTDIVILRCKDWDDKYVKAVINKCKTFSNAKYDTEFNFGIEALYCSELVFQSDFERRLKVDLDDLAGMGRQYISPTGLLHAKNCKTVYDSRK